MPPKKVQQKSKEEVSVESYFPVDEEDLKHTTEKAVKEYIPENKNITEKIVKPLGEIQNQQDIHSIQKPYKQPSKKEIEKVEKIESLNSSKAKRKKSGKTPKKSSRITTKEVNYSAPKISLKDKGYEMIITEKPQAAAKIAAALGRVSKGNYQKVPYYEVDRNGKKIVVVCAVGHLFTLNQDKRGDIPAFNISWKPNFMVRKGDFTKRYYDTILKLAKNAGSIIVATDFDVEGEVIGLNVVRYLCGQKDASRMKFSTLTSKEIEKAYEDKKNTLNWGQAIAGETRHYLDWFYGINLSRSLMNAIKTTGKFRIMSIGRVQGPALNLIVKKEREILSFKPEPFWQIFITVDDGKNQLELKYVKDIFDKKELPKFEHLKGKKALASTSKSQQIVPPNPPFNLMGLQTEAYRLYGITPSKTLQIAQGLYLAGLISYPRTSSQKLPDSIGYKEILEKLAKRFKAEKLIKRHKPVEGEKTDPAHPSIYPTGESGDNLSDQDEKIYNLIVRRFLALFCEDAIIDRKTVKAHPTDNHDLMFTASGNHIVKKAWMEIYPRQSKEVDIPDMEGEVDIINQRMESKETQPPKRYSPASILTELEKRNLGTKSTRANILETLYDRGYIQDQSIKATPLGMALIESLERHSPIIIDEELTRDLEDSMGDIEEAKKSNLVEEEQKILDKAKATITKISQDFKKQEKEIGNELMEANKELIEKQKKENTLVLCPKCKKGSLAITYSKKNRRQFIACNAYPECKTTYSLPPHGIIKKTGKACEACGFPMLMALRKGKKPWFFCFNSECKTNKERIEEYRKKQEESNQN